VLAHRPLELVAPRHEIGERAGQFAERLLDGAERCFGFRHARSDTCLALGDARAVLRQAGFFHAKPLQRGLGVRLLALFARDVATSCTRRRSSSTMRSLTRASSRSS